MGITINEAQLLLFFSGALLWYKPDAVSVFVSDESSVEKNQSRTFRRIQHQPNIRMPRQRQRLLSTLLRSFIFHDTKVVKGKVL